ncbi:MAG: acyl carrier protein [Pararhodobacter sp.]
MDGTFLDATDLDATEDLNARVVGILAAQALREPSGLRPTMTLEELGIDSLGMAEVVFAIEEAFDVAVPFNANTPGADLLDLRTVGSVCAAVARLVQEQRG